MAKTKRLLFHPAATIVFLITVFSCSSLHEQKLPPTNTKPLKIASWNIRSFGSRSRSDSELRYICSILKEYDLIAIMELLNEKALKRCKKMLSDMGRDYEYEISDEVGRTNVEMYAFLYDKHKVSLVEPGQLYPDPDDKFIREPYYATFRAGNFDFTIIVVHVIYNEPVRPCRAEIQELAIVFQAIQDADPNEQDILLVGDFNRKPEDYDAFGKLMKIKSMKSLFNLPVKTTIKDTNLYDNILFQRMYVTEYTGRNGVNKFDETLFDNNYTRASKEVSDHRPVWAEFKTNKDDD